MSALRSLSPLLAAGLLAGCELFVDPARQGTASSAGTTAGVGSIADTAIACAHHVRRWPMMTLSRKCQSVH